MTDRKDIASIYGQPVTIRQAASFEEAREHGWNNQSSLCLLLVRIDGTVIATVSQRDLFDAEGNSFAGTA